ncbi:hypothetical protein COCSADRAFT_200210 [Bipolaris sorokiniana ND90Pr]|uniref:Uncharacterized protein n=1 Tax=Cochliobolus sativus (strain ND90Pr / ATCC 201652) TaxID=665912 RepID=M2T381_COCSN|nr:uncharacterized protein COCSADRAFT_200210 [Bipolaris sorokiniana ND90Pr]EMD63671.1 hypothetical protein COCSADRAFT_200210 [Bipolaris sorokiniana ND90Pr]
MSETEWRELICDGKFPCFNCTRRDAASYCKYSEEAEAHRQQSVNVFTLSNTEPITGNIAGTVGNMFRSRDAPSFFSSSYFGPQVAAKIIEEPAPYLSSSIRHASVSAQSFRDVGGPFSQIWDLLGILPRNRANVNRLVDVFIVEPNWTIDAIHSASFKTKYAEFWERKFGFDNYASIDLFQRNLQETSLRFYWASRRAIVIAPTFYGESTDLVRAGVLVTRYLINIRLWSHLYTLDKRIALAIGRPFAIVDQQCLVQRATNVWLDDEPEGRAAALPVLPLSKPTLSVCNFLAHDLATIVGSIQQRCFGLSTSSRFLSRQPDYQSTIASKTLIPWNRLYLHSMYHSVRVTLHRPYLLRQSITGRFRYSHDACISSACADVAMRVNYLQHLGPHHLFNSALVLGIIAVKDPHSDQCDAILEDLTACCDIQRGDIWLDEFSLAEVKIIELCIKKSKQFRLLNFGAGGPFQWQASPWGDPSTDVQQLENILDSIT